MRAAGHHDPRIILDHLLESILPRLPTRFKRAVWVRTIRRALHLADGQAARQAQLNRRHMEHNPTSKLPRRTSSITRILSQYGPIEAGRLMSAVLSKIASWILTRFPHLRFSTALDEVDWDSYAHPTERESNDLWDHTIGGKEATPVFRYYVTVIIFAGARSKMPIHFEPYSDAASSASDEGAKLLPIVQRSFQSIERLPRMPFEHYHDRGFESEKIHCEMVAFSRRVRARHESKSFCVIVPARAKRSGTDDVHIDPAHANLVPRDALRALRQGPMSPFVFKALAERLACTKVDAEGHHFVGVFRSDDPGAPVMVEGLTFIVERRFQPGGTDDPEAIRMQSKDWFAFISYTTNPDPKPWEAAQASRRYRDRNFIESAFWQHNWDLERSGIHDMGARVLMTGLMFALLAVHCVIRLWRGHYVRPGRFEDYTFFDFLIELDQLYTFPDEPP